MNARREKNQHEVVNKCPRVDMIASVEFFSLRNSYQPLGISLQPRADFFPSGIHIIPSDELFNKIFSTARAQKNKVLPKERILLFVPSDPETSFRQISKANIFSHHVEI